MALIPASTKNDALLFIIMLLPGPTVCWQSALADADGVMLQAATALFMFFYSSPPGQNGYHFTDYTYKCIFMNENFCIVMIQISLKFVPQGPTDNNPAFIQVMAWS